MRFIVTMLVVLCAMSATAGAYADQQIVVDDMSAIKAAGQCVSEIRTVCNGYWNAPGCAQVVVDCDKVRAAATKVATGMTRRQVVAIVNKAVEGLASKADLDALAKRVDALEDGLAKEAAARAAADEALQKDIDEHKAAECHDGERRCTDENTPALCSDGKYVDQPDCAEDTFCNDGLCMAEPWDGDIKSLKDEVMFEIGAQFFGAPNVQVIGVAAGLQLRIAEKIAVVTDIGLGYAFDKDVAVTAKGGLVFYVTDHFGVGPTALFAKESFDDEGDVEIGGGAELRFRTGNGFFVSGTIGLGAEGVLQEIGTRPDGEKLTDREWGLAIMGGLMIGGEF